MVEGRVQVMTSKTPTSLRGGLRQNESMARHTSWRVGGAVDRFYQPADIEDLTNFLSQLPPAEPLYWVGLGSNLLVRDGGLRGTVICTSGVLNDVRFLDGQHVYVEAGVACPKLARLCARQGLQGTEFLCGIPGTMGGALALNAGAMGSETWDLVESVIMLDRQGQRHERPPKDFNVQYRQVTGQRDEWFVAATFKLSLGDRSDSEAKIKSLLARRAATQPTQQPTAGSVFRNPPEDYAARLIETAGLKGACVGGACVSEKHANFIINTGTATAADIEALMTKMENTVQTIHAVKLVREVHIVGETDPVQEGRGGD